MASLIQRYIENDELLQLLQCALASTVWHALRYPTLVPQRGKPPTGVYIGDRGPFTGAAQATLDVPALNF